MPPHSHAIEGSEGHRAAFRRWWPLLWLGLVAIGWLAPMFWTGTRHGYLSFFPHRWRFQHAVAGLFTRREASWNQPVILVRTAMLPDGAAPGSGAVWRAVPRDWLTEVNLAGYRNRMDELVPILRRSRRSGGMFRRLGEFTAECVALNAPEWGVVEEVRIVNTSWPTRMPEMMSPEGHWVIPPFGEIARERVTEVARIGIEEGRGVSVRLNGGRGGGSAPKPGVIAGPDGKPGVVVPSRAAPGSLRLPVRGTVPVRRELPEAARSSDNQTVRQSDGERVTR